MGVTCSIPEMVSRWTGLVVASVAIAVFLIVENGPVRLPLHFDGYVDPRFERVKEVFNQNFIDGWERGGASIAIYERGNLVVDLWGGYADRSSLRKWNKDTLQIVFSTTKGVAAVCVAILVDRGYVSYDDLVVKHWPEFGQQGKDNVTVQMMLSHAAGVPYVEGSMSPEEAKDHTLISKKLEEMKPVWPPGSSTGYHIYTYGWLVDQLIRRVDPKKRGIGQFVREEIREAHGVDFFVGLPKEEVARVARLTSPTFVDRLSEISTDYRVAKYFKALFKLFSDSLLSRGLANLPWLESVYQMTVNNPDYWEIEQAAAMGIGNARSLARIFDLAGERKLFSEKTLSLMAIPHYNESDLMMGDRLLKGNGLFHTPIHRAGTELVMGHTGHGCQQVMLDVHNGISMAYTTNALKTGLGDLCRTWKRLQTVIYDSLEQTSN